MRIAFAINSVPEEIVEALGSVVTQAADLDESIAALARLMSGHAMRDGHAHDFADMTEPGFKQYPGGQKFCRVCGLSEPEPPVKRGQAMVFVDTGGRPASRGDGPK